MRKAVPLYVLAVANKLKRVPCPFPSRTAAVSRSPSRSFSNKSRISRRRNAKYALTFHRFKSVFVTEKCQSCMGKQCAWIWESPNTYTVATRPTPGTRSTPFSC